MSLVVEFQRHASWKVALHAGLQGGMHHGCQGLLVDGHVAVLIFCEQPFACPTTLGPNFQHTSNAVQCMCMDAGLCIDRAQDLNAAQSPPDPPLGHL